MEDIDVRRTLPRDLCLMLGLLVLWLAIGMTRDLRLGVDAHAYWNAWPGGLYDGAPGELDAYLYSPAFAQLIWPLSQLPWPVFCAVVNLAALGSVVWLAWPAGRIWTLAAVLGCSWEILSGNVFWVFGLVAAGGFRHPWMWTFPALTKISPCVGPVWFLVRREWRSLAICLGSIGLVGALSLLVAPGLWADWLHFLVDNAERSAGTLGGTLLPPPAVRIPIAVLLVAWGGVTNRQWVVPVGMALACPVFGLGAVGILPALARVSRPVPSGR